ncbi:hypothetical protein D3C74_320730 [compost metagenome]
MLEPSDHGQPEYRIRTVLSKSSNDHPDDFSCIRWGRSASRHRPSHVCVNALLLICADTLICKSVFTHLCAAEGIYENDCRIEPKRRSWENHDLHPPSHRTAAHWPLCAFGGFRPSGKRPGLGCSQGRAPRVRRGHRSPHH